MEQSRYNGLDILKCICAFLIVLIHTPFDIFLLFGGFGTNCSSDFFDDNRFLL